MNQLFESLQHLLVAGWEVIVSLLAVLLPWAPLWAWVAFWLLAVNWVKLREVMTTGGLMGVLLIGAVMILVWAMVAPPDSRHSMFGLSLGNLVGKTVYVTGLFVIAFVCGSVQLSGACGDLACFTEPEPEDDHHGGGHHGDSHHDDGHATGHDSHGGHAADHGHGTHRH